MDAHYICWHLYIYYTSLQKHIHFDSSLCRRCRSRSEPANAGRFVARSRVSNSHSNYFDDISQLVSPPVTSTVLLQRCNANYVYPEAVCSGVIIRSCVVCRCPSSHHAWSIGSAPRRLWTLLAMRKILPHVDGKRFCTGALYSLQPRHTVESSDGCPIVICMDPFRRRVRGPSFYLVIQGRA